MNTRSSAKRTTSSSPSPADSSAGKRGTKAKHAKQAEEAPATSAAAAGRGGRKKRHESGGDAEGPCPLSDSEDQAGATSNQLAATKTVSNSKSNSQSVSPSTKSASNSSTSSSSSSSSGNQQAASSLSSSTLALETPSEDKQVVLVPLLRSEDPEYLLQFISPDAVEKWKAGVFVPTIHFLPTTTPFATANASSVVNPEFASPAELAYALICGLWLLIRIHRPIQALDFLNFASVCLRLAWTYGVHTGARYADLVRSQREPHFSLSPVVAHQLTTCVLAQQPSLSQKRKLEEELLATRSCALFNAGLCSGCHRSHTCWRCGLAGHGANACRTQLQQ